MLEDVQLSPSSPLRKEIAKAYLADEERCVTSLIALADLSEQTRESIGERASRLVEHVRGEHQSKNLMESFLGEYGLSNQEGIALMCLAEAMLRVPDPYTLDALIHDKIGSADWRRHMGHSPSLFVNASSWGLMIAGAFVREDDEVLEGTLRGAIRRLGEPVIRQAVKQSMRFLGDQFVLGRNIDEALDRSKPLQSQGYRFSYDMLGEAAMTAADADRYFNAYSRAIASLSNACTAPGVEDNPGISIKLSALYPRYEYRKRASACEELVERLAALALQAKGANTGLNVDAEEADRLELSLDIFEAVSAKRALRAWEGLGFVVQTYQRRAPQVIDWLLDLANRHERRIMLRVVKGAYWDTEIKHHQEMGVEGYPVFTRKCSTDICFMACAKKLFSALDRVYPQFATHNAYSVAAIVEMAGDLRGFEFQRLQGMGQALHDWITSATDIPSRIYAPVGVHKDLLAYLVRRLLENGANSSFVNQIVNPDISVDDLAADPIDAIRSLDSIAHDEIALPAGIFGTERANSRGTNLSDAGAVADLKSALEAFSDKSWEARPIIGGEHRDGSPRKLRNPANLDDIVGTVFEANERDVEDAIGCAIEAAPAWRERSAHERAQIITRMGELMEENTAELVAVCVREAGKTYDDAIGEIREAVDFCRYYPLRALDMEAAGRGGIGVFVCISPWNFPLAIYCGQITAALVSGNPVIAKPAAQTPLIAAAGAELLHRAGVPEGVLQLLPGSGSTVGARLVSDPRVAGVCFTGSTAVARGINRAMRETGNPRARLIAETGGLNAMIVDSTALPEQAVRDIVASSFQSAGQRCSALRLLFVQDDIADSLLAMLSGAMAELRVGNPTRLDTDVGPVIGEGARAEIAAHVTSMKHHARLIKEVTPAAEFAAGTFIPPVAFELRTPEELTKEVFGPVLHVCRYSARDLDRVVDAINDSGYGLTLGVHSRIGTTVDRICRRAKVGNVYVNRNQIGAVVGVQPFGGERLSGTGPKAGGPSYLFAFTGTEQSSGTRAGAASAQTLIHGSSAGVETGAFEDLFKRVRSGQVAWDQRTDRGVLLAKVAAGFREAGHTALSSAIEAAATWATAHCRAPTHLPGPTGEQNRISPHGRGIFLCLGELDGNEDAATIQTTWALAAGNTAVARIAERHLALLIEAGLPDGLIEPLPIDLPLSSDLFTEADMDGVAVEGDRATIDEICQLVARREGVIIPVIDGPDLRHCLYTERTVTIDTTASGGNTSLFNLTG